jgi:hypothetical protein
MRRNATILVAVYLHTLLLRKLASQVTGNCVCERTMLQQFQLPIIMVLQQNLLPLI